MSSWTAIESWAAMGPDLEIWWDSSPLVFDGWVREEAAKASPDRRERVAADLGRLLPASGTPVFRGVTTNPPLSAAALKSDPAFWRGWIRDQAAARGASDPETAFWMTYMEVIRRGAARLLPLYESSRGRFGFISGQVDPRNPHDEERMYRQALDIRAQGRNVMVKLPATAAGVRVLRRVTELGVPTNITTQFTISQIMTCARTAQEASAVARKRGVSLEGWRSVQTFMAGRVEEMGSLDAEGKEQFGTWTEEDRHWAGIAVHRRAYDLLRKHGLPSTLLLCSMRTGPGPGRCMHIEETCGDAQIMTCPPALLSFVYGLGPDFRWRNSVVEPVPDAAMRKLQALPYFRTIHEDGALTPGQFDTFSPTQGTVKQFSAATEEMVAFVREALAAPAAAGR